MCSFVVHEQTLVTKKTLRSLDPFASVNNSYQSCKNLPGHLRAVNHQLILRTMVLDTLLQTLQLHTLTVASFPCTSCLAFCRLPFSNQQKGKWQPEKETTQSTLWIHSYKEKLHTHTKYKSMPWLNRLYAKFIRI